MSEEQEQYAKLAALIQRAVDDLHYYGDSGAIGPVLLTRWFKAILNLVAFLTGADPTEVQGKADIKRGPDKGKTLSTIFSTQDRQGVIPLSWPAFNKDRKGLGAERRAFLAGVHKVEMPPRPPLPAPPPPTSNGQ